MSVPNRIDDGNWNLLIPMQGGGYEFPFSDKGDNDTFKTTVKYRQDKNAYRPRATMTKLRFTLGDAYLTRLGKPSDIGSNLYEWEDTFSSLPVTRTEYGSLVYNRQFYRFSNGAPEIAENSYPVPIAFVYEYFLNVPPNPFIAPRVYEVFGQLGYIGNLPTTNGLLVAEDSVVSIYEGKIFERKTPYVKLRDLQTQAAP